MPLIRELRSVHRAPVVCLERGWLHGPHLDVVARPGSGPGPGPSGDIPWRELAARPTPPALPAPSTGPTAATAATAGRQPLTEREYLSQARRFGRLEGVEPPYLPLAPHGSVELIDAAESAARGWQGPVAALRELALSQLLAPVVHTLESLVLEPRSALPRAAEAFAALASVHPYGAGYGTFSFRSHAEAFLGWAGPEHDPRPAFQRRLASERAVLRPVVEHALHGGESAQATRWRAALAYCVGLFEAAAVRGDLTAGLLDTLGEASAGDNGNAEGSTSPRTAFHAAVAEAGATDDRAPWFLAYRLVINLFYRQLPLLGVSPMQRYYLCHAVAELVDEVTGETWQDRLAHGRRERREREDAPA